MRRNDMTTLSRLLVVACCAGLLVARAGRACTDAVSCTIPPSNSKATGTTDGGSFDTVYLPLWVSSQAAIDDLWNGLECEKCDWDEGWGFWDVGNLNFTLARLLNGAQVVWIVRQYAKHQGFGLWRSVTDIPDVDFTHGKWWDFVAGYGADEWTPGCSDSNGTHYQGTDEYNILQLGGAYRSAAVTRASTLVHETVHQDVSHVDEDDCSPSSESCDEKYGLYSSNTMQINFLHDAAVTYETEVVNANVVRKVAAIGDLCRWIPKFAPNEVSQIVARADSVSHRFAVPAGPAWYELLKLEVALKHFEAQWPCAHCDPDEWTFKPGVCGQKACIEAVNAQNAGVNAHNKAVCETYNASLTQSGSSEQTVADAWHTLTLSTLSCLPPEAGAASAFCEAEKQSASGVGDIDPCGWLDPTYGKSVSKLDCVQEFCHDKWTATGGWRPGQDPYGCLDYICGGEACGSSQGEQQCSDEFFMAHGDPDFYIAACEFDGCKEKLVTCLLDLYKQGQWSYGDPLPDNCKLVADFCELLSRLAGLVAVSNRPIIDPGPIHELIERPGVSNPATNIYTYAAVFRSEAAAGASAAELGRLGRRLTKAPEMIAALYHAAPAHFVWLYGNQGFLETLGPGVERMAPRAIARDDLTPQGQAALAEFLRELASAPGDEVPGAIGTFSKSRIAAGLAAAE
jgi:hypothetical protein